MPTASPDELGVLPSVPVRAACRFTLRDRGWCPKQRDEPVRSELLLHLLPLSTTDFYVDTSGSPAVPFFSTESVFGKIFNVHYNSR